VIEPIQAPFSCRIESVLGGRAKDEFCAFEFPWCEDCPKALPGKRVAKSDDPMKSAIWRGWINGLAGAAK